MKDNQPALRELFFAAIDQKTREELEAYLDKACRGDALLCSRVEHLLRAHDQAGNFMGGGAASQAAIENPPLDERPGAQIGP